MNIRLRTCLWIAGLSAIASMPVSGCRQGGGVPEQEIRGESCVLAGAIPATLLFPSVRNVRVRNAYRKEDSGMVYEEGKDYTVDYAGGTLARTPGSRIPDYSAHMMYGRPFDADTCGEYPLWSNKKYFVYVDYSTVSFQPLAAVNDQSAKLPKFSAKLRSGAPCELYWYGNSIASGGEASKKEYAFTYLYEQYLKRQYPRADIRSHNISIPGYGSREALAWLPGRFDPAPPDVVFIGLATNDHNKVGIEPEAFKSNIDSLVRIIKGRYGADVVLFSSFPTNDNWCQSTHRMDRFAAAEKEVAASTRSAYVDVYGTWMKALRRKDQSSLLANNINHPNDFGHWLYEQAFEAMHF